MTASTSCGRSSSVILRTGGVNNKSLPCACLDAKSGKALDDLAQRSTKSMRQQKPMSDEQGFDVTLRGPSLPPDKLPSLGKHVYATAYIYDGHTTSGLQRGRIQRQTSLGVLDYKPRPARSSNPHIKRIFSGGLLQQDGSSQPQERVGSSAWAAAEGEGGSRARVKETWVASQSNDGPAQAQAGRAEATLGDGVTAPDAGEKVLAGKRWALEGGGQLACKRGAPKRAGKRSLKQCASGLGEGLTRRPKGVANESGAAPASQEADGLGDLTCRRRGVKSGGQTVNKRQKASDQEELARKRRENEEVERLARDGRDAGSGNAPARERCGPGGKAGPASGRSDGEEPTGKPQAGSSKTKLVNEFESNIYNTYNTYNTYNVYKIYRSKENQAGERSDCESEGGAGGNRQRGRGRAGQPRGPRRAGRAEPPSGSGKLGARGGGGGEKAPGGKRRMPLKRKKSRPLASEETRGRKPKAEGTRKGGSGPAEAEPVATLSKDDNDASATSMVDEEPVAMERSPGVDINVIDATVLDEKINVVPETPVEQDVPSRDEPSRSSKGDAGTSPTVVEFPGSEEQTREGSSPASEYSSLGSLYRQLTMDDLATTTHTFDLSTGKLGLDVVPSSESLMIWKVKEGHLVDKRNKKELAGTDDVVRVGDQIVSVYDETKPLAMTELLYKLYRGGKQVTYTVGKRERKFLVTFNKQQDVPKLGFDCLVTEDGRVLIYNLKRGLAHWWSVRYPRFNICVGDEILDADDATGEYIVSTLNEWVRAPRQPITLTIVVKDENLAFLESLEPEKAAPLKRQLTRQSTSLTLASRPALLRSQNSMTGPSRTISGLSSNMLMRRSPSSVSDKKKLLG